MLKSDAATLGKRESSRHKKTRNFTENYRSAVLKSSTKMGTMYLKLN